MANGNDDQPSAKPMGFFARRAALRDLAKQVQPEAQKQSAFRELGRIRDSDPPSYKKGGKIKKTGVYKLHKGEKVVPANKVKQEARDKKILQKTRFR